MFYDKFNIVRIVRKHDLREDTGNFHEILRTLTWKYIVKCFMDLILFRPSINIVCRKDVLILILSDRSQKEPGGNEHNRILDEQCCLC